MLRYAKYTKKGKWQSSKLNLKIFVPTSKFRKLVDNFIKSCKRDVDRTKLHSKYVHSKTIYFTYNMVSFIMIIVFTMARYFNLGLMLSSVVTDGSFVNASGSLGELGRIKKKHFRNQIRIDMSQISIDMSQ